MLTTRGSLRTNQRLTECHNNHPSRNRMWQANEKKAYAGNLPYCSKCKLHHVRPCIVKCRDCKRAAHMTRDCKEEMLEVEKSEPSEADLEGKSLREL
ncbi:hypothetical protein Tco_0787388 [Tanacetum coccineum]